MVVNLRKSLTSTVYKMLIDLQAAEFFGLCGLSASMDMQLAKWINQMYLLSEYTP